MQNVKSDRGALAVVLALPGLPIWAGRLGWSSADLWPRSGVLALTGAEHCTPAAARRALVVCQLFRARGADLGAARGARLVLIWCKSDIV